MSDPPFVVEDGAYVVEDGAYTSVPVVADEETFEAGDLDQYFGSSTAMDRHDVVSTHPYDGDNHLVGVNDDNYHTIFTDWVEISRGDVMSFRCRFDSDTDGRVLWAFGLEGEQDPEEMDGYMVRVNFSGGTFDLWEYDGGVERRISEELSEFDRSGHTDEWLKCHVEFGARELGEIRARLYDSDDNLMATNSLIDGSHFGEMWGWSCRHGDADDGVYTYADYLTEDELVSDPDVRVIDSFEYGTLAPYEGGTGDFTTTTTDPVEGVNHLICTGDGVNEEIALEDGKTDAEPLYWPERGDYIKVFGQVDAPSDDQWWFAFSGPDFLQEDTTSRGDDYYAALLDFGTDSGNIQWYVRENDTEDPITGGFSRSQIGTDWFELHIDFGFTDPDEIEMVVYDNKGEGAGSVSRTAETRFDGGDVVGWDATLNEGSHVYFDYAHINNEDITPVFGD